MPAQAPMVAPVSPFCPHLTQWTQMLTLKTTLSLKDLNFNFKATKIPNSFTNLPNPFFVLQESIRPDTQVCLNACQKGIQSCYSTQHPVNCGYRVHPDSLCVFAHQQAHLHSHISLVHTPMKTRVTSRDCIAAVWLLPLFPILTSATTKGTQHNPKEVFSKTVTWLTLLPWRTVTTCPKQ